MPSITLPTAVAIGGGLSAVGGITSAVLGSNAASNAASTQANAEEYAANEMEQQYQQTRADLLPYNQTGQAANAAITAMGPFAFNPTMTQLENSPGYQFNLYQGFKATQNAAAARGLGVSGAAEKGAAAYASGLAGNQYQNLFSNALNTYQENLGKLQTQANLGENAAAQTGAYGTQTASNIGQTAVGAANAEAAGTIGSTNAITNGLTSSLGGISNALLMSQLFGGGPGMYGSVYAYDQNPGNPVY